MFLYENKTFEFFFLIPVLVAAVHRGSVSEEKPLQIYGRIEDPHQRPLSEYDKIPRNCIQMSSM